MLFMMMAFPFVWCMFCDQLALLIVIIPIYQPLLKALEFDPVWFWTLMLLNVTVGGMTPPFGYTMFAFKGAAPNVPMGTIFSASWPFVGLFVALDGDRGDFPRSRDLAAPHPLGFVMTRTFVMAQDLEVSLTERV